MSVPGGYQSPGGPVGGYSSGVPQQPYGGWGGQARSEQDTGPIPRVPGAGPVGTSGGPRKVDPAKLLGLAVAILGALNFLWGFLPELTTTRSNESLSVFAVGPAYVPVLLLVAGLLALAAFLPGSERSRLAVAAVSVGGAAGAIVSLGTEGSVELLSSSVGKGVGAILLVVFGIVQAVVAIGAYVIGADFSQARESLTARRPSAAGGTSRAFGAAPAPGAQQVPAHGGAPGGHAAAWSGGPQPAGGGWPNPAGGQPGWSGPAAAAGYAAAAAPSWPTDRPADTGSPVADESDTGPQVIVDPAAARPSDEAPGSDKAPGFDKAQGSDEPQPARESESAGESTGPNLHQG